MKCFGRKRAVARYVRGDDSDDEHNEAKDRIV